MLTTGSLGLPTAKLWADFQSVGASENSYILIADGGGHLPSDALDAINSSWPAHVQAAGQPGPIATPSWLSVFE